jgi:hypothetical protein
MTDLHETSDPKYTAQIDTVGWIFVAFAVAITVIAAVVAVTLSNRVILRRAIRGYSRSFCRREALCDPPDRPTGGNATRDLFALLKPQRCRSSPAWRWSNSSIESQDPIDAALVPPLKRSGDVRHTLTALPALPELSLLLRRQPCPCIPLHTHTSSSDKIRRCCVDRLNPPPIADIRPFIRSPRRRAAGTIPRYRGQVFWRS